MYHNQTSKYVSFFIAFGILGEWLLWKTGANRILLFVMSPVLNISHWIQKILPAQNNWSSLTNEFVFVFPIVLFYFGLSGFWLAQIYRESGFLKYLLLISFAVFFAVIHWQAFEYLDSLLYARTG